ncbi:kinase-like protein [Testicularia cyperi]|uniref:non-specific serine/threonine protein kinase n=1 Tax=Testicularia cyperi TaxID=1882483 RepID=A0A317XYH6_9BASI|nr:kinase-like protein [Testicularia cyperi]
MQDEEEAEEDELAESSSRGPLPTEKEMLELEWEIHDLEQSIDGLGSHYKIVDRLGEGTFSSVYKAIDLQHSAFDNEPWISRGPLDPRRRGVVHVALKKIYVTSSPSRILNELSIMEDLRPAEYVSYLITAFRAEDQIVAVMPYSRHSDFRDFYKTLPLCDLKHYFRCLFAALQSVHEAGVMHRDVKPANFLYDPRTGFGTLCDFGLAERFDPADWRGKCHHRCPTLDHPHGVASINRKVDSIHFEPGRALASTLSSSSAAVSASNSAAMGTSASGGGSAVAGGASAAAVGSGAGGGGAAMDPPPERPGYQKIDQRHGVRANRAGTRGFRAPEVLFKCQDQTVAIDIWSAGVIMLSFLTRRFPVFSSNDDIEALLEIATIFGKKRMEQCALLHNRTFQSNIPSVGSAGGGRITDFILKLNPGLLNSEHHPNPRQYEQDVADALDFVKVCMLLDCTRRWSAKALLEHPFLQITEDELLEQQQAYDAMHDDVIDYYSNANDPNEDQELDPGQEVESERHRLNHGPNDTLEPEMDLTQDEIVNVVQQRTRADDSQPQYSNHQHQQPQQHQQQHSHALQRIHADEHIAGAGPGQAL